MVSAVVEEFYTSTGDKLISTIAECIRRPFVPILPMNSILIPSCASLRPSRNRTVTFIVEIASEVLHLHDCLFMLLHTWPIIESPSKYTGNVSRRSFSSLTSALRRASSFSRRISTSTGVPHK